MSLYDQLGAMTVVVADTGDIEAINKFKPRDATTNPSLITAAAQMPQYQTIVDDTLKKAKAELGEGATREAIAARAFDQLAVSFGLKILEVVPGRVSTEVDARLSYDTDATVAKGRFLISEYAKAGIGKERVLIKIASTWEGIRAAEILEKEGIHCNLTLLFGMHQAVACAEAGVTLISPFVGRILDWHVANGGQKEYTPDTDPGVVSVTQIWNYYKKYGYKTEVMGASFRNVGEITGLAGCDLLTISPKLLDQLRGATYPLPKKLDAAVAAGMDIPKMTVDKAKFDTMHAADTLATQKLDEGIKGFSKALELLEQMLATRLARIEGEPTVSHAAKDIFMVYDLDGDGFITREEWAGTDAVFDALDVNHDGKISPEEMAAGMGAAFNLH